VDAFNSSSINSSRTITRSGLGIKRSGRLISSQEKQHHASVSTNRWNSSALYIKYFDFGGKNMKRKPVLDMEKFVGLGASLSMVVGILALFGAVMMFFSGDYLVASLNLIAAGLGFGLFLVAVLSV
jgi:hypothetical protein